MEDYRYTLEPYNGSDSRHECPKCHDPKSFTYYLDKTTHSIIDMSVGRCNHESSCGYHYTPKDYLIDNPNIRIKKLLKDVHSRSNCEKVNEKEFIPSEYLSRSKGGDSNFVSFLESIIDTQEPDGSTLERLIEEYHLGYTKDKAVIFWQVDISNNIRTGKIMQYNPVTGKRLKDSAGAINWVHAALKNQNKLSESFSLNQCLFGEHLLKRYPDRKVVLVESEKTAIIGSGFFPYHIWLATGGKSQLSAEKLKVLMGRTVIMFPDIDGYDLWKEKAKEIKLSGCNVVVSDLLNRIATQEDRDNKIDIADLLIREAQSEPKGITEIFKDSPFKQG